MHGTSSHVESARVDECESALSRSNHGRFRETDIVADGKADLSIVGKVDNCQLVSGRQDLALLECDLSWNINVEQMGLAVGPYQRASGGEHEGGVIVFLRCRFQFRDATSYEVGLGLGSDG